VAATRRRVVSWNIRAAIGPGPFPDRWWRRIDADRLRAIGAFRSSLDADLIALQEVTVVSRDGTWSTMPATWPVSSGWTCATAPSAARVAGDGVAARIRSRPALYQ
jgi:endonuclease/exonuclease/phosphatase family metal-dependent hydrolase